MMRQQSQKKQRGYTFVELAIVLVIMGILAGGIAVGRELIESAKIKSLINDFESFKQAHYLYIKRTGHPPGIVRNTDGNMVADNWGLTQDEYFDDLIAEGLIVGVDSKVRSHAYDGSWYSSSFKWRDAYHEVPQICAQDVPIWVAEQVDAKLDDGFPSTGRVLTGQMYSSTLIGSYAENSHRNYFNLTVCLAL